MESTLSNYVPVSKAEAGKLCEALRMLERSIVWYGTADKVWERLARFTADEMAPFLQASIALIAAKLRHVRRRRQPELFVLTLARLLFHNWTGWYAGHSWVDEGTLREIRRLIEEYLRLTAGPRPETNDDLVAVLHGVWKAQISLQSLAPPGRPSSKLRFFGCDEWGKPWRTAEIRRSA